jgi:hypothetical protein
MPLVSERDPKHPLPPATRCGGGGTLDLNVPTEYLLDPPGRLPRKWVLRVFEAINDRWQKHYLANR